MNENLFFHTPSQNSQSKGKNLKDILSERWGEGWEYYFEVYQHVARNVLNTIHL